MSFTIRNLSVLAYASSFTLWHYRAGAATLGDIAQPGFFDDAIGMMATGDMIHVSALEAGATVYVVNVQGHVAVRVMQSSAPPETVLRGKVLIDGREVGAKVPA